MEKLHKEPNAYKRDFTAFLSELKQFHQNRGTPFRHHPRINGREIDLFSLYNQVTALGGWKKVNDGQRWDGILDSLKLPKGCVNASLVLRQIYIRYLSSYEKIHYLGEDPDDDGEQTSESRSRKQQLSMLHQVPMSYNHIQHEVTDSQRMSLGMCQDFITPTDYDKLLLSLLSGLPNEEEFALNVCTLLSNEGKHMLHLERNPRFLEILIAQAGVWSDVDKSLESLYTDYWKRIGGRKIVEFWRDTVDATNPDIEELLGGSKRKCEDEEDAIFNLGQELGVRNSSGQRVLRVALILHNLSFEKYNVPVLVNSSACRRFLLLCAHCRWSSLRQIAMDTLGNLAGQLTLDPPKDVNSRLLLKIITQGVESPDRFTVLHSLEILAQLSQCTSNEDLLPSALKFEVYQRIFTFLTLQDMMLLVYALEALYTLSELGRIPCERMVQVHRAVATLVSLLSIDPQSYGPSAMAGMKLVETFEPVSDSVPQPVLPQAPSKPTSTPGPPATQTTTSHATSDVDSETFACNWLRATYELSHGHSVSRNEIYAEYVTCCSKAGRKGVINANLFANCVRTVFPHSGLKRAEGLNGVVYFHHDGLRRRSTPLPVSMAALPTSSTFSQKGVGVIASGLGPPPRAQSPMPPPNTGHSPILKAQLSAPPRPFSTSPSHQAQQPASARSSVSPSPPPSPHYPSPSSTPTPPPATPTQVPSSTSPSQPLPLSGTGSTLIKSLLASKVCRNLQRQQQHHPTHPATPISPAACLQTLAARPSTPSVTNRISTFLVQGTPIQAAVQNIKLKGPPTMPMQHSPVTSGAAMQLTSTPKLTKARVGAVSAVATRLNGVQREMQLEARAVCSQAEEAKNLTDASYCQEAQIERITNHVVSDEGLVADIDELQGKTLGAGENAHRSDGEQSTSSHDTGFSSENELVGSAGSCTQVLPKIRHSVVEGRNQLLVASKKENGTSHTIIFTPATSPAPVQPTPASNLLKSVLGDIHELEGETKRRQHVDKIYRSSPLLNGLLDKGRIPLFGEKGPLSANNVQNGNSNILGGIQQDKVESKVSSVLETIVKECVLDSPPRTNSPPVNGQAVIIENDCTSMLDSSMPIQSVTVPSVAIQSAVVPNVVVPSVIVPSMVVPNVTLPSATVSSMTVPSVVVPSMAISNMVVPNVSVSSMMVPGAAVPRVTIPSTAVPSVSVPSMVVPNMTVPSVVVPSMNVPNLMVPSTAVPNIDTPCAVIVTTSEVSQATTEPRPKEVVCLSNNSDRSGNSSPVSDLSSISDIARTLETASKAISRTNAECNSQVPLEEASPVNVPSSTGPSTAVATTIAAVLTVTPSQIQPMMARTMTQTLVVVPAQSIVPNSSNIIRFRLPSAVSKLDDSGELIGFPRVSVAQLNQIRCGDPRTLPVLPKRPSTDASGAPDAKRLRQDAKMPLLEASLRTPFVVALTNSATAATLTTPGAQLVQSAATLGPRILPKIDPNTRPQPQLRPLPVPADKMAKVEGTNNQNCRESQTQTLSGAARSNERLASPLITTHSTSTTTTGSAVSATTRASSLASLSPSLATAASTPSTSASASHKLHYTCEWKGCSKMFRTPMAVFVHSSKAHVPEVKGDMLCEWENCDGMKRKRLSLLTHLQDRHCNDQVLHMQAMRRQQVAQFGKSTIPPPQPGLPHPGYAPDAAVLAIRRHALQFMNAKELALNEEEKETPLTKSIRLTAALILRNLAVHSPLARSYLMTYEQELSCIAISSVESSRTVAHCLSELAKLQE